MKALVKRCFDFFFSAIALVILSPIIVISWLVLMLDTKSQGLFFQQRVGQYGKLFTIYKLKTMHPKTGNVTKVGSFFRKYKLDELPQFLNVLKGQMSIVGPRPDIPGYYDALKGEDRKVLELKPGITSEASLKYFNEEALLAMQKDALHYNDTVIFPDKVKLNLEYYHNNNLIIDLKIIIKTIFNR